MLLETIELADMNECVVTHVAPEAEKITVDEANLELVEVANEIQDVVAESESIKAIDDSERRFWMEIDVLGEISKCNRNIQESESAIDDFKCQIKEEKEFLKGEQIRLQRLASKLSDIIDGKPLPIDPNKPQEAAKSGSGPGQIAVIGESDDSNDAWRNVPTSELLDGLKGLGTKKLNNLMDAAPTAGHLEDLRGEASKAHKSFREVLPTGFGQTLADAIEDRLIQCVASCSKSAAEQAAEEQSRQVDHPDSTPLSTPVDAELSEKLLTTSQAS